MRLYPLLIIACLFAVAACAPQQPEGLTPQKAFSAPPAYDYPINNPYAATVLGVPQDMQVNYSLVPEPTDRMLYFPDRHIPEGFWYDHGLKYSELLQRKAAPLVYVIGGTGADSRSHTTLILADILYAAGFSVVMLPSPTHPDFIINAGSHFLPGRPVWDGQDIYRVIARIDPKVAQRAHVTRRMMVGYSLGGFDALFAFKAAEDERTIRFDKLLLINPPLNLYHSMQVIDQLLYQALPHGINDADRFIKTTISRLSGMQQSNDALDFTNERLLLGAYSEGKFTTPQLMTIIGLSFRLSGADMIFTADAMGHYGYVFPKNWEFTTNTSVDDYMAISLRTSFQNYTDELYRRQCLALDPAATQQSLIQEGDMQTYAGYIVAHPNVGLIANADDIILAPGEFQRLTTLFAHNSTATFPTGGHLGNLAHPAVGYRIIQFLKQ